MILSMLQKASMLFVPASLTHFVKHNGTVVGIMLCISLSSLHSQTRDGKETDG